MSGRNSSTHEWQQNPAGLAASAPARFTIGVATSAFQIEGAIREGGRGPSTWDVFMGQSGRILDASDASVAADHYHRYREDVALMRELGVDSYRFSLSWPRVQPGGKGAANREGIAFYDRLLDELLAAGIRPMVTLYHWDTPEELQHAGGWLNRDTAYRLADYAFLAGEAFGDRVDAWVTINEPATVTLNGYALGLHAPGATLLFDALPAAHHQLLGHGLAVQALRAADVSGGVGITNVHSPVEPDSDREEDAAFAELFDIIHNRIYADPVLLGRYPVIPEAFRKQFRSFEEVEPADLATISTPLDFYGLNYYFPSRIAAGAPASAASPDGRSPAMLSLPFSLKPWPEYPTTCFGWPVAPSYLGVALRELAERYGSTLPPIYLTEGGASFADKVSAGSAPAGSVSVNSTSANSASATGAIDDADRIDYLADHLTVAFAGVPDVELHGYFVWSLLDNWEWVAGFTQRFGLVHLDVDTQDRTPKRSFWWLQTLLASR